ncbi:MAG: SEC-C domain-containing protein [Meiothermus sp.]|nr:SEC-C domain-containing protein [Meiothermus sp.]
MTMLIAMANEKYCLLLADRRITSDGKVVNDDYNKLCVFFCDDAKLAVAFTGLATFSGFDTSDWLAKTLSSIVEKKSLLADILADFVDRANVELGNLPVKDIRSSFLMTGFSYWGEKPEAKAYTISNFTHDASVTSTFTLRSVSLKDLSLVEVAGNTQALSETAINTIRSLLERHLPPPDILRFSVHHLQAASRSHKSGGLVGEQCNSVIMLAPTDTTVTCTYHTIKLSRNAYGPNVVLPDGKCFLGPEIFSQKILAGPEIRKKDPCWCGSGQEFRHCHMRKYGSIYMRQKPFRRPLTWFIEEETEVARPSGKRFTVNGGFK